MQQLEGINLHQNRWGYTGKCLKWIEDSAGYKGRRSATAAKALAKSGKLHTEGRPPGIIVPIWFSSHSGMGHVAWQTPDDRCYDSNGEWESREALENYIKRYNPTYLGWTERVEQLQVVNLTTPHPVAEGEEEMIARYLKTPNGSADGSYRYLVMALPIAREEEGGLRIMNEAQGVNFLASIGKEAYQHGSWDDFYQSVWVDLGGWVEWDWNRRSEVGERIMKSA